MGIDFTAGGETFAPIDYTVTEEATPIAAGDSSGGIASFSVRLREPSPHAPHPPGIAKIVRYGPTILHRKPAALSGSRRGSLSGTVATASKTGNGEIVLECVSRLALLNVYNVQAKPFVGTLGGLFAYYFGLAKVTSGFTVDSSISGRSVVAPGWNGELWYYLKLLCAAEECEIALVGSTITVRRIRTNHFVTGRTISSGESLSIPTLARSVEVYSYNSYAITNRLVYPVGGWKSETEVLNVNAGETAEYILDLSASVSSIVAPTMMTSVAASYSSGSAYTIVANDGLPVTPAMWSAKGGRLSVKINEDTTSLTVTLVGATGIPTRNAEEATNFSVALGSDATGNRYSTLRIVGTGVAYNKEKVTIATGVQASETGTEVGVTIDNPFLRNTEALYRAGIRAAIQFSGIQPQLQAELVATHGGMAGEFGRVAGGRVWDEETARYYRVVSAQITQGSISGTLQDDTIIGDREDHRNWTVGQYEDAFGGLTLGEVELIGLRT